MKAILDTIIAPALALLPPEMTSQPAKALLLTIGMQESRFTHRVQIGGPAHGLWQFERIGVTEVLRNRASRDFAVDLCWHRGVAATTAAVYHRLDDDDVLAACFARLALWRHPAALPGRSDYAKSWRQYLAVWAPGKPHRETWDGFYKQAWEVAG